MLETSVVHITRFNLELSPMHFTPANIASKSPKPRLRLS